MTKRKVVSHKIFFVYMLASKRNGTLYVGMSNDLERRVFEHKNNLIAGFTKRYKVHSLIYYEVLYDATSAIQREKQLKWWHRKWKLDLIEKHNPNWIDLVNAEGEILPLPIE
jgi:putative endonuclease